MFCIAITVRVAAYKDADKIHELIITNTFQQDGSGYLISVSKDEILQLINQKRIFVAEISGNAVGCVSVVDYGTDGEMIAELRSLIVDANHRGKGIGKALLEHAKKLAGRLGYKELYALVNKDAFSFFLDNGFEFLADRPIQKVQRDCIKCPLYNNGCKEATFVYRQKN